MRIVLAVALASLLACSRGPRYGVKELEVVESVATRQLAEVGLDRAALRLEALAQFERAPRFVPRGEIRGRVRAFRCRIHLERVEVLSAGPGSGAIAHVALTAELSPGGGEPAMLESARAAEPAGAGAGALRSAIDRAFAAAMGRAVAGVSLQLAAERKSGAELIEDLSSPDPQVRDRAVRVLGARRDPAAVPALVARLRDPDAEIVERTVGALAQLRDARAVPALIELAHHRDGAYVANLARIVGDLGGPEARAWLLTMASGHPDERVRSAAAAALEEMPREPRAAADR